MFDVTALYTNIDNERGLSTVRQYIVTDPEVPVAQQYFFLQGLKFILNNNYFIYNNETYRQ